MTYTYTWWNEDQTLLKREDGQGEVMGIPVDPFNTEYLEFLESGAVAEPCGPPPPPPTTAEKIDQLLTDYNLTRDELRAALYSTQEVPES